MDEIAPEYDVVVLGTGMFASRHLPVPGIPTRGIGEELQRLSRTLLTGF